MIAIDTNILARFYVQDAKDDPGLKQHKLAARIMGEEIFVSHTVALEFEWVLRGAYRLDRSTIIKTFEHLQGLGSAIIEHDSAMTDALRNYQHGLDFADALHLAAARHCAGMATFDKDFAKLAKRLNLTPPCLTPS